MSQKLPLPFVSKADMQSAKGLYELLLKVPSFSPQLGILLLQIAERVREELKQHPEIVDTDRRFLEEYATAAEHVAHCGGMHQKLVIDRLEVFVDRGKVERILGEIERAGGCSGQES